MLLGGLDRPLATDEFESMFGVVRGTYFPLHYAIEHDAVELGALHHPDTGIDPGWPGRDADNRDVSGTYWAHGAFSVRAQRPYAVSILRRWDI